MADHRNNETEQLREIVRTETGPLGRKMDRIMELMTGNGNPEKGLIVRVDRLEQKRERERQEQTRSLTIRMGLIGLAATVISSGVAAVITAVVE